MSLDHFILRFTGVFCGVGGACWVNIADICRVLAILYICWVYPSDLGACLCGGRLECRMAFYLGSICRSGGIVGSSYVMVSSNLNLD